MTLKELKKKHFTTFLKIERDLYMITGLYQLEDLLKWSDSKGFRFNKDGKIIEGDVKK